MATAYGYKVKKERFGKEYYDHIAFLRRFETYSREQQKAYQFTEMMKLLQYAINHSTFYRNLYEGINIESFRSVGDLKLLPIVTKEMLRQRSNEVTTIPHHNGIESNTGGTTGKSLTVYFTKEDIQKRMASLDYFKMKHGFENIKMKRATFSGKHIIPPEQEEKVFWRYNAAIKQMLYSSFHITEQNISYYIESLNQFKPDAIDGFVSSIYDIALYIVRHNVKLSFVPMAVVPTSETVTQEHRNIIEKAFQCKMRDQYASSEGAPFVYECGCGHLHYDLSTGVIEPLDDSNEVVVTSFTTYGTPLIRYRIGDSMIFENPEVYCDCGFQTPLVKSIQGRAVDFLYTTSGGKINLGNISNIFKYIPKNAIVKSQIVQNSLTSITVKIVVDKSFEKNHVNILIDEIKHKFGSNMNVEIQIVDDIPREKSGKYKLIINNVK